MWQDSIWIYSLLHIHTKFAVTQSLLLPLLWTQLVHSWNSWISLPGGEEPHISFLWANSKFSPVYYFWHFFPIPQSLTYQENKQNQHNKLFVFLILLFVLSSVSLTHFSLPPTFVPCPPVQQTPSNLIQLFLFFFFLVTFPPGSHSLCTVLNSFLIQLSFPLSSLPNPLSPPTLVPGSPLSQALQSDISHINLFLCLSPFQSTKLRILVSHPPTNIAKTVTDDPCTLAFFLKKNIKLFQANSLLYYPLSL